MNLEAGGEGLWSMRENLVIPPDRSKCRGWEPLSSPKEQEAGPEATGLLGQALAEDGLAVGRFIRHTSHHPWASSHRRTTFAASMSSSSPRQLTMRSATATCWTYRNSWAGARWGPLAPKLRKPHGTQGGLEVGRPCPESSLDASEVAGLGDL